VVERSDTTGYKERKFDRTPMGCQMPRQHALNRQLIAKTPTQASAGRLGRLPNICSGCPRLWAGRPVGAVTWKLPSVPDIAFVVRDLIALQEVAQLFLFMQLRARLAADDGLAILGAEHEMNKDTGKRLRHERQLPTRWNGCPACRFSSAPTGAASS